MDGLRPEQIHTLFRWFKEGPPGAVPVEEGGRSRGMLQAVTWEDAGSHAALELLAAWHRGTAPAARAWLVENYLQPHDRVLFWVRDVRGEAVGHVGLAGLDADDPAAIADALGGDASQAGLMDVAIRCLAGWVRQALKRDAVVQTDRAAA